MKVSKLQPVVTFSKTALWASNALGKGDLVYVQGQNKTSKYEKDGEVRYSTDVVAQRVQLLKKHSDGGGRLEVAGK